MARVFIEAGASFDALSPREFQTYMDGHRRAERDRIKGIKFRRLPPINGQVSAAGTIQLGGDTVAGAASSAPQYSPAGGHLWVIRLLAVSGLTAGASPDVLNMQIFGAGDTDFNWWQFNGNNFAYGFGKNEIWLNAGEYLSFTSPGTVQAAPGARIRVRGMLQQVPEELAAEMI